MQKACSKVGWDIGGRRREQAALGCLRTRYEPAGFTESVRGIAGTVHRGKCIDGAADVAGDASHYHPLGSTEGGAVVAEAGAAGSDDHQSRFLIPVPRHSRPSIRAGCFGAIQDEVEEAALVAS
jgi:hypothetical protein